MGPVGVCMHTKVCILGGGLKLVCVAPARALRNHIIATLNTSYHTLKYPCYVNASISHHVLTADVSN